MRARLKRLEELEMRKNKLSKNSMTKEKLKNVIEELESMANELLDSKGKDYTNGSEDVLINFKRNADRLNTSPLIIWAVYLNKHIDAINSYCGSPTDSTSEAIESRFVDALNYIKLGYALVDEGKNSNKSSDNSGM